MCTDIPTTYGDIQNSARRACDFLLKQMEAKNEAARERHTTRKPVQIKQGFDLETHRELPNTDSGLYGYHNG